MKTSFRLMTVLLAGLSISALYGQESVPRNEAFVNAGSDSALFYEDAIYRASEPAFDFFASEEPLSIELYFDIKNLVRTKNNPEYNDAVLTIHGVQSDSIVDPIEVKARGNMRCSYCAFPPIMLKFKDDELVTGGNRTLKLVTPCFKTSQYEAYVMKEYLAYKLYNVIADYSFRTRLVKVTYVDAMDTRKTFTAYGFLIENENEMAGRNEAVIIKTQKLTPVDMNPKDMAKVSLFNYMIGNTDWSVQGQHNIKIMMSGRELTGKGIPVVYDFDYSGLVSTPYAAPFEELPIKSVSDRYYQGLCLNENDLNPILDEFGAARDQMLGIVKDFQYLPAGDKKQIESYLNTFFGLYKNRRYMTYTLNSTCRQPELMVVK